MGVPATFFAECQTLENLRDSRGCLDGFEVGLHGYAHEDFTLLDACTAESIIRDSCGTFRDILGRSPEVFRFPYMRTAPELLEILPRCGIGVDSSLYSPAESCRPYRCSGGLVEVPVLRDPGSGRTSYLWPAHEGKRDYGSFISLAESVGKDGTFVLCDHTWHICESREKGVRTAEETRRISAGIRSLLESLLDLGFVPDTVSGASVN